MTGDITARGGDAGGRLTRVAVFTGASIGRMPEFATQARAFGAALALAGVHIVYGGGRVGLMGAVADGALEVGGAVTGVMPRTLVDAEIAHPGVSALHVVGSMHERKAVMADLADAFVALPGGAGTLDELFEAWTWQQLGLHTKAVGLLNILGYWNPLLAALDTMAADGFLRPADRDNLIVANDAQDFLDRARAFTPNHAKWNRAPTVESVAWLSIRDGRLLGVRTVDRDVFYLPGGKPEPGESSEQALARELSEELDLHVDPAQITKQFTIEGQAHGQPGAKLTMTCFTGPATGRPVPGREIAEMAWLGLSDLDRCAPALKQVIQRLGQEGMLDIHA